jgi:hypothetical protein
MPNGRMNSLDQPSKKSLGTNALAPCSQQEKLHGPEAQVLRSNVREFRLTANIPTYASSGPQPDLDKNSIRVLSNLTKFAKV